MLLFSRNNKRENGKPFKGLTKRIIVLVSLSIIVYGCGGGSVYDPNYFVLNFFDEIVSFKHQTPDAITVKKDGTVTYGGVEHTYTMVDDTTLSAGFDWEHDICVGGSGTLQEKKITLDDGVEFSVAALNGSCTTGTVHCAVVGDWEIDVTADEDPYYTSIDAGDFEYYAHFIVDGVTFNDVWVSRAMSVYDSWTGQMLSPAVLGESFIFQKAFYELSPNGCDLMP